MTITALPTAPLATDSTSVFNSRAFALLQALSAFVSETNATASQVDTSAAAATTSKNSASASATASATSATASDASAALATIKAVSATDSATSALSSAAQSLQSAAEALASKNAAAESATQAASSVSAQNLPSMLIGQKKKILKVNEAETGYDLINSVASPRLYGFALSTDGTEIILTEDNTGSFSSSSFISLEIGENLSFSILNNELALTI